MNTGKKETIQNKGDNLKTFADNMIGNILQGTQAAIDDMIKHDVIEEHPPNQPDPWI